MIRRSVAALRGGVLLLGALTVVSSCSRCGSAITNLIGGEPPVLEPRQAAPSRAGLGTNLDGFVDWSSELPFLDAFHASREWSSAPAMYGPNDEQPMDLDEHGWPRSLREQQIIRTGLLWENRHAPAGRYVVLYDGEGELEYFSGLDDVTREPESRNGRHVLDWNPAEDGLGFGLAITRTDPENPVRNIRVILPGGVCEGDDRAYCDASTACEGGARCVPNEEAYATQVFNPRFLVQMDLYGAIRYMNWQAINNSRVARWSDRSRVEDARWSDGKGVPLELIVDLANRTRTAPWICIPHLADDDFVRRAGRLVAERLDEDLPVYLEYSNEVWNDMFDQARWAHDQGLAAGLGWGDGQRAKTEFYSRRSVQVFRAFSEGFPDRNRVIRVLGSHAPLDFVSEEILNFESAAQEADALAIAPYFGTFVDHENRSAFMSMSVDQILERAAREQIPESLGWVRAQREVARRFGVRLLAYEAGQHFIATGGLEWEDDVRARLDEVDRHPRFEELYVQYFTGWREAGGGLMMHFVHAAAPGPYGHWGATYYVGQPASDAPKLRGILRFLSANERWW